MLGSLLFFWSVFSGEVCLAVKGIKGRTCIFLVFSPILSARNKKSPLGTSVLKGLFWMLVLKLF